MARVRLNVELVPGPLRELSTQFGDEELWILSGHHSEETSSLLVGVELSRVEPFFQFVANEISAFDILSVHERSILLKIDVPTPEFYRLVISSGNLVQYPLVLRDGWILCELLTSHSLLSSLGDVLDDAAIRYELESIVQSEDSEDLLTKQQQRFVLEAIERGYYDHPRTYSLTELATDLDVSKSTASVVLHRAEGKIIRHFFGRYSSQQTS
ncbi:MULTISPECIES: helix-turn-helix domain-containing protein [unclassified Haladaptatus]|uniref:helix-turn-helix domain-containing protein n=1 Tax=unclassified Haladaptatus TaxID=2622732 RepID=UPI00209C46CE|nr:MULTISPECIES: helix-turn-helix domain-containing protein [unclassified Haladaptatus]MCO8242743.1 helix-turn-helix domain-containing protein [Haladaptatus sp. AB643]MCO8252502.1 helix-turn-helix domain-containing protein [Haladaptatus sp. AB618]